MTRIDFREWPGVGPLIVERRAPRPALVRSDAERAACLAACAACPDARRVHELVGCETEPAADDAGRPACASMLAKPSASAYEAALQVGRCPRGLWPARILVCYFVLLCFFPVPQKRPRRSAAEFATLVPSATCEHANPPPNAESANRIHACLGVC